MNTRLILASASPRRQALLKKFYPDIEIQPAQTEEKIDVSVPFSILSMILAFTKAEEIAKVYPDAVVVGADTIVTHGGVVLGKPKDEEDAERILKSLANDEHQVYTGVAIVQNCTQKRILSYDRTTVLTTDYEEKDIKAYVSTGEPFDKAGAYGIQGFFSPYIKSIHGSYFNVVGLPIHIVHHYLKKEFGICSSLMKDS